MSYGKLAMLKYPGKQLKMGRRCKQMLSTGRACNVRHSGMADSWLKGAAPILFKITCYNAGKYIQGA